MELVSLHGMTEHRYFDQIGKLSVAGQYKFWHSLNTTIEAIVECAVDQKLNQNPQTGDH